MKKPIFTMLLMFLAYSSYGQMINNKKIENITSEYINVTGYNSKKNPDIYVDYGQSRAGGNDKIQYYNGKDIEFKSPIDAVNYLRKYGYEVSEMSVFALNLTLGYSYLLKKTKDKNE